MAATNGVVSRKAAPAAKPIKNEHVLSLDTIFDELENESAPKLVAEVREKLPKIKNGGAWTVEVNTGSKPKDTARPKCISKIPMTIARAFPNRAPMKDRPEQMRCTHCKRPVAKHVMTRHVESCLNKKQEKQRKKKEAKDARDAAARKERAGSSDEEEDGSKKTATKTGGMTASKKRKAADEGDDSAPKKKKKKDDLKAKAPRPKAPVDVEKQCGVELPQGGQCARSLTCKSHSMGAKRAVPGRSAPYDKLLMEYQRKNAAKQQKAQFDANAPNPDDYDLPSGPVDSDEERDAVMSSINTNWGGQPLYQPVHVPLRQKYDYNRMKGMLSSAFAGSRSGMFGSVPTTGGFFSSAPIGPTIDADGMIRARKGSVIPGARSMIAPAVNRKMSTVTGS